MLLLAFRLGDDRFAFDAGRIVEVLPLVAIKPMRGAPPGIAGSFNYRGRFVPAVDVSELLLGRAAEPRLSTRVVLANLVGEGGPLLLGMITEHATGTMRVNPRDKVPPAFMSRERPWLGAMVFAEGGPVQLIDLDRLLPDETHQALVAAAAEVA